MQHRVMVNQSSKTTPLPETFDLALERRLRGGRPSELALDRSRSHLGLPRIDGC